MLRVMILLAAGALGGCSMADSNLLPAVGEQGCHSHLGAYFLPRDYLHVEVRRTNAVAPHAKTSQAGLKRASPDYEMVFIELRSKADRTRGFCLDYLGSQASNDYLEVKRNGGLLIRVGTTNRNYSESDPFGSATPDLIPLDSEDVTTKALAQELIDKSLAPATKPDGALADVTYPWVGSAGSTQSIPYPDNPKMELFCKREATDQPKDKRHALFTEFCTDAGTPLQAPLVGVDKYKQAVLNSYFAANTPKRTNHSPPDPAALTRLVYSRKQTILTNPTTPKELTYLESGGITGTVTADYLPLARNRDRREVSQLWHTDTSFSADFDPANPVQAAVNNFGLKEFGFCVLLNDGVVDLKERDSYCDDPESYAIRRKWNLRETQKFEGYVSYSEGLLYRPRINYTLYVFKKKNMQWPGGWQLHGQHMVNIPNLSPMISVGVKRTLFANRNTIVEFDRGALRNIAVKKDSELSSALEVPLSLVKRIGALPTNIVKVRIRQTDSFKELAQKQTELLQAETDYNESLRRLQEVKNSSPQTDNPNQ